MESQAWDEWQEEYDEHGYYQGKGKRERMEEDKKRKVMDVEMERENAMKRRNALCEPITFYFATQHAESKKTIVVKCLLLFCDACTCGLNISEDARRWEAMEAVWSFRLRALGPVAKVDEEGVAFHTENQMLPAVVILDLGCARAMGPRNAINAFCQHMDRHDCGLWYLRLNQKSSRFFFANLDQTKCTKKVVIFMYAVRTTKFDLIGEEGNTPLLMSLPRMNNLILKFELSPQRSCLNCAKLGI